MKYIKICLIIIPILLTILLGKNIYDYFENKKISQEKLESINNYDNKLNSDLTKYSNLNTELETLKEVNKEKIMEYERWIKWNNEIVEKMA